MSNLDIVRAWKDRNYRNSLNKAELAILPENPAGMVEISDADLEYVAGGRRKGTGTGTGSGAGCECWCECSAK